MLRGYDAPGGLFDAGVGGRRRQLGQMDADTALKSLPTVSESGLPGYSVESFYAVVAPAGTSRAIIAKLNAELVRNLKTPEVTAHMAADGAEVIASTPDALATALREDYARWAKPVKDSGARVD